VAGDGGVGGRRGMDSYVAAAAAAVCAFEGEDAS